jgi:uncharacterized zinc-type alcohol dehydrogenase-like protein
VPGHEIVGTVSAVGEGVTRHKIGDRVAIGCMVDACMECAHCDADLEQYCQSGGMTGTYNGKDRRDGTLTFGGYSERIVCREEFVLKVPEGMPMAEAAPLLCAGITSYSPLRTWKVGPGSKVAVAGLGGLGHMGVKLAAAMGAEVTVLSRSESKRADAEKLGAHAFLNETGGTILKNSTGTSFFQSNNGGIFNVTYQFVLGGNELELNRFCIKKRIITNVIAVFHFYVSGPQNYVERRWFYHNFLVTNFV